MNMSDVGAVFDAAPPLKYAEDVDVYWQRGNWAGIKALRLSLDYDVFRQISWTFLQKESACELRLIKVSDVQSALAGGMNHAVEDHVRHCVTLPHLQGGEPLEPDFSDCRFSGAFGLQIIEMLKGAAREVTFRMGARQDDGELIRQTVGAHSRYSIGADNDITRYASDSSGITVKVKGYTRAASRDPCRVAIQRPAEVPRKNPRTSEEV